MPSCVVKKLNKTEKGMTYIVPGSIEQSLESKSFFCETITKWQKALLIFKYGIPHNYISELQSEIRGVKQMLAQTRALHARRYSHKLYTSYTKLFSSLLIYKVQLLRLVSSGIRTTSAFCRTIVELY